MRRDWIHTMNVALREHGLNYSRFIYPFDITQHIFSLRQRNAFLRSWPELIVLGQDRFRTLIRQLLIFRIVFKTILNLEIFLSTLKHEILNIISKIGSSRIRTRDLQIISQATLPLHRRGCCAETTLLIVHKP